MLEYMLEDKRLQEIRAHVDRLPPGLEMTRMMRDLLQRIDEYYAQYQYEREDAEHWRASQPQTGWMA